MSTTTTCPTPEQLDDLVANRLGAAEAEAIRNHMADCGKCAARSMDTLPSPPPCSPYAFLSPAEEPEEVGRLDQYRILDVLGEGGMSIVFDAEDTNLHRPVALKMLKPKMCDPTTRERFLREARLVAGLPHEHIVTIYDVGESRGLPYLTMERLEGQSLQDRLKRDKWLPLAEALDLTREAAEGLVVAHEQGLVHRDVKPDNIWLEERGGRFRRVKLIDFGIARMVKEDSGLTADGQVLGTPMYMAPEQARGWPVDGRADLYSLGCVLFHVLAGRPPFEGRDSNTIALLQSVMAGDVSKLQMEAARLPPRVAELIHQLMSRDPDQRPASARVLVERLKQLKEEPLAPGPVITTRPNARSLMRRPGLLGIWLGIITITAALAVGAYEAFIRFRNDQQNKVAGAEGEEKGSQTPPAAAQDGSRSKKAMARASGPPLKVGVLHSMSGTLSMHEVSVVHATTMAIEEINADGGVLGRPLEAVVVDGESDAEVFSRKAEDLIVRQKVDVLFGCWSSSARKRVAQVCEKHDRLLFYSVGYEGLVSSPNVVYLGGTPNQTLVPAVRWAYADKGKRRFFLLGSDEVYSHALHAILAPEIQRLGGKVVGERYVPNAGLPNLAEYVEEIKKSKADVVINTIDGQVNVGLFRAMRAAGLKPPEVLTLWNSISEPELRQFRISEMVGDCSAGCYFESLDLPRNRAFVEAYRKRYSASDRVNDPMQTAYFGVHLWKNAIEKAGSAETAAVKRVLPGLSVDAPEGTVRLDEKLQNAWRTGRVGEVVEGHKYPQFDIVFSSPGPVRPQPFPEGKTPAEWKQFLDGLFKKWGDRWEKER